MGADTGIGCRSFGARREPDQHHLWPALPSGSGLGLGIPGRASRDDRLDLAYEPDDAPLEARALPVCAERNTLVHLTDEQHPDSPGH